MASALRMCGIRGVCQRFPCRGASLQAASGLGRARAQERQFVSARSERRDCFGPESSSLGVGALIVAGATRSGAKPAFVGHHGVMPGGQSSAERLRLVRAETGTKDSIRIHVTLTLSRGTRPPQVERQSDETHDAGCLFVLSSFVYAPKGRLAVRREARDGGTDDAGAVRRRRESRQPLQAEVHPIRARDTAVTEAAAER